MAMACGDNWQSGKTLSQSASFMLDNEIATDVTFKFRNTDETIKAHRFVLMARSHVFFVMFNSELDKPGEDIDISDIEPPIFKEFLKYLYTDETTLSAETALHLTYCAEKYEVTHLKAKCTYFLQSQVDETTIAMVLDHAVLYNDDVLISTCRNIIKQLENLSCLEEHHITKDAIDLVLGFEGLVVSEVDIFKFCNTWAENECKRMEVPVNGSNIRKMLGPLLRRIPFCSMTQEEFATEVSGKHLLNGQEELQIFRFICAPDGPNPPFPCKPKKEPKKLVIAVKLPKMQGRNHRTHQNPPRFQHPYRTRQDSSTYRLQVSCSKSYTLLGLGFTQAGNYDITFDASLEENFSIQEGDMQGFLKKPMQNLSGVWQFIQSVSPLHDVGVRGQPQTQSFSHVEHVQGQAWHMQLDFSIVSYDQPPFDTLIVQV